jgi:hypothetical protein
MGGSHALHAAVPAFLSDAAEIAIIISVVLALLAVVAVYGHLAQLHGINGFVIRLVAWVDLVAGVLIRGI